VTGLKWPTHRERLERLGEAVQIIREPPRGKVVSHRGRYYLVDDARIYMRPDVPPSVYVSGCGTEWATNARGFFDLYSNVMLDRLREFALSRRPGQEHETRSEAPGVARS